MFYAQVTFELLQTHRVSFFTVTIESLGTFTFNVTSEEMTTGSARFTLPLRATTMNICSVRGVTLGGNDAGNSTTADIQLPSGELRISTHYSRWTVCIICNGCVSLQSVPSHYPVVLQSSLHQQ